jgi:hypothetical protein
VIRREPSRLVRTLFGCWNRFFPESREKNRSDARNRRSYHQQCGLNQSFTTQTSGVARDGSEGGRSAPEGASREGEPGHDASPSFYSSHHNVLIIANFLYCQYRRCMVRCLGWRRRCVAIIDRTGSPKQRKPHMADDQHDYKVGPGRPPLHCSDCVPMPTSS